MKGGVVVLYSAWCIGHTRTHTHTRAHAHTHKLEYFSYAYVCTCIHCTLQIQYVLSHKVFDPTVLCRDLHVCPSTSVGTRGSKLTREQDDKAFLLRFRDIMMDLRVNAPLKHENMPVVREGDLLGLYSGALPVASSGKQRQRRAGDKIRILQFSDLHLDHLYKEVWGTVCTA